jgi:hypothetical protein
MRNCLTITAPLLAASLLGAGLASAQAPTDPTASQPLAGEQVAPTFESIDLNKDNLVSEQEASTAKAMTPEAFAAADADRDGYLTPDEFKYGA